MLFTSGLTIHQISNLSMNRKEYAKLCKLPLSRSLRPYRHQQVRSLICCIYKILYSFKHRQLGSFYTICIFHPFIRSSFPGSRAHLMYVYFQKPRSTLFSANGIFQIQELQVLYDMVYSKDVHSQSF